MPHNPLFIKDDKTLLHKGDERGNEANMRNLYLVGIISERCGPGMYNRNIFPHKLEQRLQMSGIVLQSTYYFTKKSPGNKTKNNITKTRGWNPTPTFLCTMVPIDLLGRLVPSHKNRCSSIISKGAHCQRHI